jgi:hypothetical protein
MSEGHIRRIELPGALAFARAVTDGNGRIRHITVEIEPISDDPTGQAQMRALRRWLATMQTRWGKPETKHAREVWQGESSLFTAAIWSGFLRGSPSLVVDLLPLSEKHVCGERDGFDDFFSRFRSAMRRSDQTLISAMIDQTREAAPEQLVCTGTPWLTCAAKTIKRLDRDSSKPRCNFSREIYQWVTAEPVHGGQVFTFWRKVDGTWKVAGPRWIDHDYDTDQLAP